MKQWSTIATLLLLLFCSCSTDKVKEAESLYPELRKQTYPETSDVIANPERGLYHVFGVRPSGSALDAARVKSWRGVGYTLYFVEFILSDFLESDISEEYLDLVRSSFDALREGGAKGVIRFCYTTDASVTPHDASLEVALRHIAQLKPILQANEDVIFCVQAGFVGTWGEWYYTSNFGFEPSTSEDYEPRRELLNALLDAVPENRQVAVRTPTFKMKIFDWGLSDTLTLAQSHGTSAKARVCGHNDAFCSTKNDMGTFGSDEEREYWKAESKYLIMGGETDLVSEYSVGSSVIGTMQDYHWTYLNVEYHSGVIGSWKNDGSYDVISDRLGYRLVLDDCYFTPDPTAGGEYRAVIRLHNDGFAAPMNPRELHLSLLNSSGETVQEIDLGGEDPRCWQPGLQIVLDESFTLPSASGNYSLALSLPDPEASLRERPEYSIRFANDGVWDEEKGFNLLTDISL